MTLLSPLPRDVALRAIAETIDVLDRYGRMYKQLSGGRFTDYASYMGSEGFADEDEFVKPKLFTDFLEQVLAFGRDEYVPEHATAPGVPDFQPVDTLLHPFFFEIKGSNSLDLAAHLPQLRKYLRPPFDFGVLTDMRDIRVYDAPAADTAVPLLHVSLLELYRAYKSQPKQVLDFPNTVRFLEFVDRFRKQELDRQTKVEKIRHTKDLSLLPKVDPDELVVAIRNVVQVLAADAREFRHDLEAELRLPVSQRERQSVTAELVGIAQELDRRYVRPDSVDPGSFIKAREGTIEHRAFDVYLTRVAYFAMVRILLARIWEDVGFIEQQLYDGGFKKWYETLGGRIREVLRHAFGYAADRYDWLYRPRNNYIWYRSPSENAVIDVLYEFARFNLGTLDSDVLGTVYEQFVDRVDRKSKGQYYTPREVISFIWDRVGFTSDDAYFNYEDGRRTPKMVLDVATGSGGFLVEAAHRIRTRSNYDHKNFNGLLDIMMGITQGLCGCEISQFAHHITEVNLLIQLTPVIRDILAVKPEVLNAVSTLGLSTVPGDSLGLVCHDTLFSNNAMARDRPRELLPKDPKDPVRQTITDFNQFDFVCSNPPYVGEKGHKELFHRTLAGFPFWQRHYQGKMDYLYWFIILGLLKLKEGGKLGFVTTSYWPTADGASHLREFILEQAIIREVVDFGETRIFEGAPGQHNMVFVLEKCSDQLTYANGGQTKESPANLERKQHHRVKVVKVKTVPPAKSGEKASSIARVVAHISRHIDQGEYSDDIIDICRSALVQSELSSVGWHGLVPHSVSQVVARVEAAGEPLQGVAEITQGIVSGADRVTARNIELVPTKRRQAGNVKVGAGIFALAECELATLGLQSEGDGLVRKTYKNSAVSPYVADLEGEQSEYVLYVAKGTTFTTPDRKAILRHLERFRGILAAKRETREGRLPWFSLHWPRAESILNADKIVTPRWGGDLKSFAYQTGEFYENSDLNIITPKPDSRESLKHLLGLLNSSTVQTWMSAKARQKGLTRQSILLQIPIRRIDFEKKSDVVMHDKIVSLVDRMISCKQELARLNGFFATRLTRLHGPEGLPEPDVETVTRSLKGTDQRRVHNHPKVVVRPAPPETFVLARVGEVQDAAELFDEPTDERMYALRLGGKRRQSTSVFAPKEILQYLRTVLPKWQGKPWDEIREIPVARDLATYRAKEKQVTSQARRFLKRVASIQSEIDALAYKLYGLTEKEIAIVEALTPGRRPDRHGQGTQLVEPRTCGRRPLCPGLGPGSVSRRIGRGRGMSPGS